MATIFTPIESATQGDTQGLEDAVAPSEHLPVGLPKEKLNNRLRLFEEIRRPRVTAYNYGMAEYSPLVRNSKVRQSLYDGRRNVDGLCRYDGSFQDDSQLRCRRC